MDGTLAAPTLDVDQAFEACSNDKVLQAWRQHVERAVNKFGSANVLVHRGHRNRVQIPARGFRRGCLNLSLSLRTSSLAPWRNNHAYRRCPGICDS
eukprot:2945030-Pyramimonas_sp.AAC.1